MVQFNAPNTPKTRVLRAKTDHHAESGYVMVSAKPVTFDGKWQGLNKYKFALHRDPDKTWVLLEPKTGMSVGYGDTQAQAVDLLIRRLESKEAYNLDELISGFPTYLERHQRNTEKRFHSMLFDARNVRV